jgi:glycine/D-amino acid oxidase-like deaminating enzyme
MNADVVIIGAGIIGLSTAFELGRSGASCIVLDAGRPGAASGAAAGLLAPSIGHLAPDVEAFFRDSLNRFPALIGSLREFDVSLAMISGLIDVSDSSSVQTDRVVSSEALRELEPSLAPHRGARYFSGDGAIDNVRLLGALRAAVRSTPGVVVRRESATALQFGQRDVTVVLESGARVTGRHVVLAAGAWSRGLKGLPRPLPIRPLKGQMLALESHALRHAVMGNDVYLVPRQGEIAIGATVEEAGFDLSISSAAVDALRSAAISICPSLASAPVLRSWAGLRPATPDMLPIIGRDEAEPRLIYASGHSKNGILLAPATSAAVVDLCAGRPSGVDISPFSVDRFEAPASA